jgi:hypothetical protein
VICIKWHTAGTTRLTICVGRYALKLPRGQRGRVANYGERVEWKRATPERCKNLCPLLWAAPFGLLNVMRRAIPLTEDQRQHLHRIDGFPKWDYMPDGPSSPFEHKASDWGYLDGRLVALDYPAMEVERCGW